MMKMAYIAIATLSLTGCLNGPYVNPYIDGRYAYSNGNNTTSHSQDTYKMGQEDGCKSGDAAGSMSGDIKKDVELYTKDEYYKSGWDEQFAVCKSRADKIDQISHDAVRRSFWW